MRYRYQAMTNSGATIENTIDADTQAEAADALRREGKLLLRLHADRAPADTKTPAAGTKRVRPRDLLLFTRQMKMLLESGSALVPALEAIERQSERPALRNCVRKLREHVEAGGTLSEAVSAQPRIFSAVYSSMVGAGEASATLPDVFGRLSELTQRQQTARKALLGAMAYPAFLVVLCLATLIVLLTFVVPRFHMLFDNLNRPLPYTTMLMFDISEALLTYWPLVLGVALAAVTAIVLALKTPVVRSRLYAMLFDIPAVGRVLARFEFMRVLRVWSAMLSSNVALLDAIAQSRHATSNPVFRRVLDRLEEAVASGGHIGASLSESKHIDPIIAAAVTTGEENGRLSDSVAFVTDWLEQDNIQMLATLTRIAEPLLLSLMGLAVGCVSAALFMPLFDIATM